MSNPEVPDQPTQVVQPGPVEGFSEGNGVHPANDNASVIDLLKQDVEEISQVEDVYIPVKGYERTGLAIRYHLPERHKELDTIANKVNREFKDNYSRNLHIGIDTMVYLCSGLYVKHPEPGTDEWVELDPQETGEPVHFDTRLAGILGWDDVSTARQVVKRLFGGNELAINVHAERLNRWLANTKADINQEFWQQGE
jgi:hypothetical protein